MAEWLYSGAYMEGKHEQLKPTTPADSAAKHPLVLGALGVVVVAAGALALWNPGGVLGELFERQKPSKVIALVNDIEITERELKARLTQLRADATQQGRSMPPFESLSTEVKQQVVDLLINEALVMRAARELEVVASDEQVDNQLAQIRGRFDSEDAYQQELADNGFTPETFREHVTRQLTGQLLVASQVAPERLQPTEAEIQELYEEITAESDNPPPIERFRAQLESQIQQRKTTNILGPLIGQLREQASIVINLTGVTPEERAAVRESIQQGERDLEQRSTNTPGR